MLQRSHHLLRCATRRFDVHLLAVNNRELLPTADHVERARRELASECAAVEIVERPADASPLRRLGALGRSILSPQPWDVSWVRSRRLERRLAELATGERFDLLHVDSIGLAPSTRLFPGRRCVLNHHNVESAMMDRRARRERSPRRIHFAIEARKLAALERRECPRFALNLVVSRLDDQRLRAIVGKLETRVVPNGVDTRFFRPRRPLGHGTGGLLLVGGMDWYPNRDAASFFLREIWPALLRERPERRASVIGAHPPRELTAAHVDRRLSVPGFVRDVRPYLDEASIFLCPMRDGGGTRLKVIDALAMAKPVVATALAVEGLDLEEGRHFLRAESVEDFVRQVRRLEDQPQLRGRLAREGRALVERRFAWEVVGRELEDAYLETVEAVDRGRALADRRDWSPGEELGAHRA
jgi:glycosyltransferase involved in cell wall biosynthesis